MPVVTIEGRAGSFAPEFGRLIADRLEIDLVDRLLLADIARKVGSTVQALAESERRRTGVVDRLAGLVQRMLERSAVAGTGGDPYFGPGIDTLLSRPYRELDEDVVISSRDLGQDQFIQSTREVISDIAEDGSVVIVSRGGGAILRDEPNVLRIGLVADLQDRIKRIMDRESLNEAEAAEFIEHSDSAQAHYFERAFNTSPIDPFLYHVMINTSEISLERAVDLIAPLALELQQKGKLTGPE